MTSKGSDSLRLARHERLAELVRLEISERVMVSVASLIPTGSNFIFGKKHFNFLEQTQLWEAC